MKMIQVDMYAVGLGAALLTQFKLENGGFVSVLADGGVGPGGYSVYDVHNRLGDAFTSFGNDVRPMRIDLIVGTHYDADHLKGLVPIAEDDSIEIGEVWLPPVKDDLDDIPGHVTESGDYLVHKFYDDLDGKALLQYFAEKKAYIEELRQQERQALQMLRESKILQAFSGRLPGYRYDAETQSQNVRAEDELIGDQDLDAYRRYFEEQEGDAARKTGTGHAHDSATYDSNQPDARDLARGVLSNWGYALNTRLNTLRMMEENPERARVVPAALANIRKSVAAGAITASHLHKLVQALHKRKKAVRPLCHYISMGYPSRFVWVPSKRRFINKAKSGMSDLVLSLLGPSDTLVEKHREKLPIGAYLLALDRVRRINLEGITESNQLSYIFTLEMGGQRLLISGDAGCYGFKGVDNKYFPDLLSAISPLHVVQIAHHAGHNYDFYNTLLAAGFADQEDYAYLLLSHEIRDAKRPSDAFRKFIAQIREKDDDVSLLFTSTPEPSKVQDYDELICPVMPKGAQKEDCGDFRLAFSNEAGKSEWVVERHVVAV